MQKRIKYNSKTSFPPTQPQIRFSAQRKLLLNVGYGKGKLMFLHVSETNCYFSLHLTTILHCVIPEEFSYCVMWLCCVDSNNEK